MKVSTSILNSNDRVDSVLQLNCTNTSYIHIDVMDGKFVPNIQFKSSKEIRSIEQVSKYPLDIHLMVENPLEYVNQLKNMNIEFITFHLEVIGELSCIIKQIKEKGYKVGISIKPSTDIQRIVPYLEDIDLVLIMSVEPGFGGQKFLPETIERVKNLKNIILKHHCNVQIEVDGGISDQNVSMLKDADIIVVGSYIIKSDHYDQQIKKLFQYFSS